MHMVHISNNKDRTLPQHRSAPAPYRLQTTLLPRLRLHGTLRPPRRQVLPLLRRQTPVNWSPLDPLYSTYSPISCTLRIMGMYFLCAEALRSPESCLVSINKQRTLPQPLSAKRTLPPCSQRLQATHTLPQPRSALAPTACSQPSSPTARAPPQSPAALQVLLVPAVEHRKTM